MSVISVGMLQILTLNLTKVLVTFPELAVFMANFSIAAVIVDTLFLSA